MYEFVCFVFIVKLSLVFFDFIIVTYDFGGQISFLGFAFFDVFVTSIIFSDYLICVKCSEKLILFIMTVISCFKIVIVLAFSRMTVFARKRS